MNKEISLLIFIEVKPGLRNNQIEAFNILAPLVLAEEGCLQYELKSVESDENSFVLIEKWSSQKDLDNHDLTPHMIEADKLNPSFRAKAARVLRLANI